MNLRGDLNLIKVIHRHTDEHGRKAIVAALKAELENGLTAHIRIAPESSTSYDKFVMGGLNALQAIVELFGTEPSDLVAEDSQGDEDEL